MPDWILKARCASATARLRCRAVPSASATISRHSASAPPKRPGAKSNSLSTPIGPERSRTTVAMTERRPNRRQFSSDTRASASVSSQSSVRSRRIASPLRLPSSGKRMPIAARLRTSAVPDCMTSASPSSSSKTTPVAATTPSTRSGTRRVRASPVASELASTRCSCTRADIRRACSPASGCRRDSGLMDDRTPRATPARSCNRAVPHRLSGVDVEESSRRCDGGRRRRSLLGLLHLCPDVADLRADLLDLRLPPRRRRRDAMDPVRELDLALREVRIEAPAARRARSGGDGGVDDRGGGDTVHRRLIGRDVPDLSTRRAVCALAHGGAPRRPGGAPRRPGGAPRRPRATYDRPLATSAESTIP